MCAQALLYGQEIGECNPRLFRRIITYKRLSQLSVSATHVKSSGTHSITSMEIEPMEYRYLISTGSSKKISIHDTWNLYRKEDLNSHSLPQVACVGSQERHKRYMHKNTVNFVQWYPRDTGLFVTSSLDGTIKIWDTNKLKPAETMQISSPIYNHHLSPTATTHLLIAAATTSRVRLADIRSGSTTHMLRGHVGNVLCVRWSPKDEFHLASGSVDNKVLMWDVRHAKSILRTFDQHNSESSGDPTSAGTAHTGTVNSIRFNDDGRYLLTYGTDDRMRLWNTDTGENTLVNYGRVDNDFQHLPLHMTIYNGGPMSSVAFVPAGRQILMFDLYAGHFLRRLTEHLSTVRCCELNPRTQEFYSAAQNSNILVWSPDDADAHSASDVIGVGGDATSNDQARQMIANLWQDDWSDSD
uniref:CKN1 Cockayne syndrome 1 homolog n=1 Tax=Phallusia mammillata TaxID=59560 RepID=A0A6F9DCW0_9ASCI|nr:CKN1 Cockayne syndrome 1 homolog [Phallusia mammillata]